MSSAIGESTTKLRKNLEKMEGVMERYEELRIRESFSLPYRYPIACRELSSVLRLAYSKLPKPLQYLVFEDTLAAFRLLSQMQAESAVSAANSLIQSAEASLPKQKRVVAVKEFRQAMVAYKRQKKHQNEEKVLLLLPQDVLVHLFSFLDLQSLVSAGLVCRSWNKTASDDYLWQIHYATYFGNSSTSFGANHYQSSDSNRSFEWKDAFRREYIVSPRMKFKHSRGYCQHCNSIVWLSGIKCPNNHIYQQVLPILSPSQVVEFVVNESPFSSDSDSDEELGLKLWAYQRRI